MLTPPAITLKEWAESHGVNPFTARKWAREPGGPLADRAWLSGGVWLIRPDESVPEARSPGRPAQGLMAIK